VLSESCGEDADEAGGANRSANLGARDRSAQGNGPRSNWIHHVGRPPFVYRRGAGARLATIAKAADVDQGPHAGWRHEVGIGSVTVWLQQVPSLRVQRGGSAGRRDLRRQKVSLRACRSDTFRPFRLELVHLAGGSRKGCWSARPPPGRAAIHGASRMLRPRCPPPRGTSEMHPSRCRCPARRAR
jgi:hypothetical protein